MQARLNNWLSANLLTEADVRNAVVVFGSAGSYFARTHKAMDWYGLPKGLDRILESGKNGKGLDKKTRTVAMGLKGTWVVVWQDGTCEYDLGGLYPNLEEKFKAHGNKDVNVSRNHFLEKVLRCIDILLQWISLSVHTRKHFFLSYTDGSFFFLTINILDSMLQTYLRQRSEKLNVAYRFELETKDAKTKTVVLPLAKKGVVAGSGDDTSSIKDVAEAEGSAAMGKVEDLAGGTDTEKIEISTEEVTRQDTHTGEQSLPRYEDLAC